MKLSDERLEEIRAWLCGESAINPSVKPEEMAAMANPHKTAESFFFIVRYTFRF